MRGRTIDTCTNGYVKLESLVVPTCSLEIYPNDGQVAGPSGFCSLCFHRGPDLKRRCPVVIGICLS